MKLGIISLMEGVSWGGSEELWMSMAEVALKDDHTIIVSVKKWNDEAKKIKQLEKEGARIFRRDYETLLFKVIRFTARNVFQLPYPLYLQFKRQLPDAIIVNDGGTYSAAAVHDVYWFLKTTSIPFYIIAQQNSDYAILSQPLLNKAREIFLKAEQIFFVSSRNLDSAEMQLAMKLPKASVVRNPVNLNDISYVAFPVQKENLQIACVARLYANQKGQHLLFTSLAQIQWKAKKFVVNLYGVGEDEKYLRDLAAFYGIMDRIQFRGFQSVREIWKENHALLLPSLSEGTPLAMVEAMLCGRPIIGTDVAGINEWVDDNVNGFISPAPTVELISKTLIRALGEEHRWKDMGICAREKALSQYDPKAGKTLLEKIQASVL